MVRSIEKTETKNGNFFIRHYIILAVKSANAMIALISYWHFWAWHQQTVDRALCQLSFLIIYFNQRNFVDLM